VELLRLKSFDGEPHEGSAGEDWHIAGRRKTLEGQTPGELRADVSVNSWDQWRTLARRKALKT